MFYAPLPPPQPPQAPATAIVSISKTRVEKAAPKRPPVAQVAPAQIAPAQMTGYFTAEHVNREQMTGYFTAKPFVVEVALPAIKPLPTVAAPTDAPELTQVMTVPVAYRFGACQAAAYVMWHAGWKYNMLCAPAQQMPPLPFGESAPAIDWVVALATGNGIDVVLDNNTKTATITSKKP